MECVIRRILTKDLGDTYPRGKHRLTRFTCFTQCRPYFTVLVNNVVHPSEFSYTNIHKWTAKNIVNLR